MKTNLIALISVLVMATGFGLLYYATTGYTQVYTYALPLVLVGLATFGILLRKSYISDRRVSGSY